MKFLVMLLLFTSPTLAFEGKHREGHEKWHSEFYQKLIRPDTKTSCCNMNDCSPTEVRAVDDHYEVMKDGRWVNVPSVKIVKEHAPDGGAHVCAPSSNNENYTPDEVFCVILPFET